ncbi:hypothetical protein NHQ30_000751 [Ciborinia camelliae]|nr:hypothetical protein NHQ30_000751 [Ciborinia camelliae]
MAAYPTHARLQKEHDAIRCDPISQSRKKQPLPPMNTNPNPNKKMFSRLPLQYSNNAHTMRLKTADTLRIRAVFAQPQVQVHRPQFGRLSHSHSRAFVTKRSFSGDARNIYSSKGRYGGRPLPQYPVNTQPQSHPYPVYFPPSNPYSPPRFPPPQKPFIRRRPFLIISLALGSTLLYFLHHLYLCFKKVERWNRREIADDEWTEFWYFQGHRGKPVEMLDLYHILKALAGYAIWDTVRERIDRGGASERTLEGIIKESVEKGWLDIYGLVYQGKYQRALGVAAEELAGSQRVLDAFTAGWGANAKEAFASIGPGGIVLAVFVGSMMTPPMKFGKAQFVTRRYIHPGFKDEVLQEGADALARETRCFINKSVWEADRNVTARVWLKIKRDSTTGIGYIGLSGGGIDTVWNPYGSF